MSVATLLETLRAEIQAKTAELPILYAQLGLPATTLSEELTALQRRLVDGVDEVVDGRRREVDGWMERCKALENGIKTLLETTGAYASHIDRAGSETILPKRLEALSKDRDKLQSLYNSKLEQRIALMSHLKEFARVLGDDILPEDANAESTQDQPVDVSPDRLAKLERDIVQAKAEISRRRLSLAQTLDHLVWLHNELGVDLPTDPFTDGRVSNSRTLDTNASVLECFVKAGPESLADVEPTKALLEWSTTRVAELEGLKSDRELQIQNLYDQLELLWKRLGIDDKDIDEFVESWRGSTETVIEAVSALSLK
jgi:protein regulator of cytokinesis 1